MIQRDEQETMFFIHIALLTSRVIEKITIMAAIKSDSVSLGMKENYVTLAILILNHEELGKYTRPYI